MSNSVYQLLICLVEKEMKLHKILLPNEQQDDNSNNNKIPAPCDK